MTTSVRIVIIQNSEVSIFEEGAMDHRRRMLFGRRGFILTLGGAFSGILLSGGKPLHAGFPQIKRIVRNLEKDLIEKSRPARDPSVLCRTERDKAELYRRSSGEGAPICRMNQVGKFVWDACNGKNTPREISSLIEKKYAVSHAEAYEDCILFLSDLRDVGAVSV